ncbi:lamin tail domain-containing protein 1-like, partial [Nannospalax galili]|uniref:lamin tail domain-containing protein 1-like n=1 Tax=Nannospalax galili TaxID=1026970 RepID=UPI0004ED7157
MGTLRAENKWCLPTAIAFSKVWATASDVKPQPPTDFVWEEQSRFRWSPDCTTILGKPNGEAIAWYTPIHWKQAWEKLETDTEFERCSVTTPSLRSHMFWWMTSVTSISNEGQGLLKKESPKCQLEVVQPSLTKDMEIPPTIFSNSSPWCRSPYTPPHPYCSLIEPYYSDVSESNLRPQLKSQPTNRDPATELECLISDVYDWQSISHQGMDQWVTCFLCEPEDLRMGPQYHIKSLT